MLAENLALLCGDPISDTAFGTLHRGATRAVLHHEPGGRAHQSVGSPALLWSRTSLGTLYASLSSEASAKLKARLLARGASVCGVAPHCHAFATHWLVVPAWLRGSPSATASIMFDCAVVFGLSIREGDGGVPSVLFTSLPKGHIVNAFNCRPARQLHRRSVLKEVVDGSGWLLPTPSMGKAFLSAFTRKWLYSSFGGRRSALDRPQVSVKYLAGNGRYARSPVKSGCAGLVLSRPLSLGSRQGPHRMLSMFIWLEQSKRTFPFGFKRPLLGAGCLGCLHCQ